jgi:hypothetical protein
MAFRRSSVRLAAYRVATDFGRFFSMAAAITFTSSSGVYGLQPCPFIGLP